VYLPFHTTGIDPNEFVPGFANIRAATYARYRALFLMAAKLPIYRPWFTYALAMVGLVYLARRARREALTPPGQVAGALFLSAFMLVLPLFLFTPTADFRYNLWAVMATMMGSTILVVERLSAMRPASASATKKEAP
jgi:hypothetical protein